MKLVDVHCHLESAELAPRLDAVLEAAARAGVVRMITASIRPEQWPVSSELARRHASVECALGVHPWYIRPGDLARLEGLRAARDWGAVAIGEVGLDSQVDTPSFDLQAAGFEAQLRIALDLDLPLVIHCRGAFNELLRTLKRLGLPSKPGVIHNFSGSPELACQLAELGLAFSLGGVLTYRNSAKKARVLKAIYPDFLLLETDSPDIPPVEKRGEVNEPAFLRYNLEAAAETLECDAAAVALHTTRNAARVFGLDL